VADLKSLNTHLEALGRSKPNRDAREKLTQGLMSKWDGVCVTSAKALCNWGDAESIAAVREALVFLAGKPARWAAVGALSEAVAPKLKAADVQWVVQLLVKDSHVDNVPSLRPLLDALPSQDFLTQLRRAQTGAESPQRRTWLQFMEKYSTNRSQQSERSG